VWKVVKLLEIDMILCIIVGKERTNRRLKSQIFTGRPLPPSGQRHKYSCSLNREKYKIIKLGVHMLCIGDYVIHMKESGRYPLKVI
jgi:hypothetical protein